MRYVRGTSEVCERCVRGMGEVWERVAQRGARDCPEILTLRNHVSGLPFALAQYRVWTELYPVSHQCRTKLFPFVILITNGEGGGAPAMRPRIRFTAGRERESKARTLNGTDKAFYGAAHINTTDAWDVWNAHLL